ncbi:glucocorticoid receptor-like [Plakobranchus ocellatus]|uniref:Glucocorticoid receptor-like n=1 Tax=Plakobranchus ocellatus TaxID=259542 RepID=A0AAV3Z116_9GAST|nr:glucocorticoid receptor-like [Plakobranchus ocellatus]
MSTMAGRSELGISPVLLQAIAQTLTSSGSSSSLSSPRDTATTTQLSSTVANSASPTENSGSAISVLSSQSHPYPQEQLQISDKSLTQLTLNRTMNTANSSEPQSSGGSVSHLLQNLNEPVASLLSQPNMSSSPTLPSAYQSQTDDSRAVLTQAGLSMLGISASTPGVSTNNGSGNGLENLAFSSNSNQITSLASSSSQQYPPENGTVKLSSDEMANFLLKQEPSGENISSEVVEQRQGPISPDSTQNINNVSNMLSALASQHVQESQGQKSNNSQRQQESNQAQNDLQTQSSRITPVPNVTSSSTITAPSSNSGVGQARSQPQIIIYRYINSEGQEVTLPVTSSNTGLILNDDGSIAPAGGANQSQSGMKHQASAATPATYRVLLQPQGASDGGGGSALGTIEPTPTGTVTLNLNYSQSSAGSSSSMASDALHSVLPTFIGADGNVVVPITDAQNTQDGMSQPCPVCGDKVSGYHYGIFTCESCKGFFKRTVQNKKTFVCPKAGECTVTSQNRKKCPACRFKRCLQMGMKLEAIRQDRTRGGRSSYDGCSHHIKPRVSPLEKKIKRVTGHLPGEEPEASPPQEDDGSKSHRNLVAILNHSTHKQTSPSAGVPQIPELLRDIMNLEPLLSDDDLPADTITESPFPEQAVYSYMMQLAELRLYKLVRWARNLPQFGAISTDDQILLLQNCWSELMALSLCWRSIDTPNQISISSSHHITAAWAHHLGFEDVVIQLINITDCFRRLFMDQFEYVALKVLLLITPDVKGLKEPRKIRDFQDKLLEALLAYTTSHYKNMRHKFGELLLRLPELSRISFMSKDILLRSLPASMTSCGLLVELLKGDNKGEGDSQGGLRF